MTIIKCKMCGGDIELSADKTYGTCDSCGSTMTFPKVDDEHRANLFNRANHFRRQNEFDKAVSAYERILNEDDTDAEAHWGVVLSRFGIEYVEDPVSHERIPTCHRVQVASILTDEDYLAALEHALDSYSRELYEAEAKRIADIQKGILAISAQEKPYDVFICYKESTDGGSRTKDSTLAQDIYYQLKQEGFKVFFARITLEDKLGQQYEPYIFAALNSAKVMLVVGTKPEYFNAVWVKNEWSRYLALMKQDRSRLLIPCYRDMDAYDLPGELSALQSQDMSKIGFMQDLIRGVKKVLGASKPQQTVQAASAAPVSTAAPLLRRAFMFLEDGDWDKANDFCEQVLNLEPENAEAYLGKLMANLNTNKREQLKDCANPFDNEPDYAKALRFGDAKLKAELQGYIQHINDRNEQTRLEGLYMGACDHMERARSEYEYKNALQEFDEIPHYKDAAEKAAACREKAEIARKNEIYDAGRNTIGQNTEEALLSAIRLFESIPGWKDADELIPVCQWKIRELRDKAVKEARKRKTRNTVLAVIMVPAVVAFFVATKVIIPKQKYDAAVALKNSAKYSEAIAIFAELEGFRDSEEQIAACETARKYNAAVAMMRTGRYSDALAAFSAIKEYRDSEAQIAACKNAILDSKYDAAVAMMRTGRYSDALAAFSAIKEYRDSEAQIAACKNAILDSKYDAAVALMNEGKYKEAYDAFVSLNGHKDSVAKANTILNEHPQVKYENAKVGSYITFGTYEQDANTSNGKEDIEWLVLAKENNRLLVISRYALDCKPYNNTLANVTWETCTLRKWLNNDFLKAAFSSAEKAMIPTVMVSADKNPDYSTNPGNATQDKVFLLSLPEVNKYFTSDSARQYKSTAYAQKQGVYTAKGGCWWWLRSPGGGQNYAALVDTVGGVYEFGNYVSYDSNAVRPALWINLEP